MTAVPDAWDECAACGHDRDDHHHREGPTCDARLPDGEVCGCPAFEEPA